ncbi:MAG: PLDc N-terminal domain-containing protein [Gammaproteobacteria bacterium]
MHLEVGGFFGLLVLVADIWAVVNIVQGPVSNGAKVLWVLLVIVLPVIGFIVWLAAGPRGRAA